MACVPGVSHRPQDAVRARERKYWLFQAAWDGCLRCVKHFLEGKIVQPQEISNSSGFSALDWAFYGQENEREGADDVVAYLQREWPTMPYKKPNRKRRSGRKRNKCSSAAAGSSDFGAAAAEERTDPRMGQGFDPRAQSASGEASSADRWLNMPGHAIERICWARELFGFAEDIHLRMSDVQRAFRHLSLEVHPDKRRGGGDEDQKRLCQARDLLVEETKRSAHATVAPQPRRTAPGAAGAPPTPKV